MSKKAFIGRKLREARMYRGKTIDVLAKETNINKKDIIAFEEDKYKPTLENEMKLSNALGFPREFFKYADNIKMTIDSTHIRPECTIPKVEQIAFKEKLAMTHRILTFLEGYIQFPQMNISTDLNKNEDIEELATKVRRYWNLGDGIIGNMLTLLEINGIIVSDANINKKGALSFSQKQTVNGNSRYFVSLGNDKKSACTRNYDLAYELAYIVATEANIQSKKFSKDEFACAFLMPKESFIQDLKMVNDLEDYVELKKKWIVPISAIILRSYQLGEISYKKYMYLMNEMDKKGWLKKEPLEENIKATSPMLLKKSIDVLIDNNIMSKASLVMNLSNWGLHLNQDEVEVLLGFKEGKLTTERNTINNKKSKVTKVNFKSKKR